jgi:hypothetical protein
MTQPGGEGQGPANTGQGSGVQTTLFTQEQVNHFNAQAKREALGGFFKELGLDSVPSAEDLKGTLTKAGEFDKLQAGKKDDVERLTGELATANEKANKVPGLEAKYRVAELAAEAGLKPRYWKYVEGKTDEEIQTSIKAVLEDIKGGGDGDGEGGEGEGQQQQPGTGARPPAPNPQQGAGGGKPPTKTMQSGAEAYAARHKKADKE